MFRDLLSQTDLSAAPVVALLIFFAGFVGVLVWVSRRAHGEHFERMNRLPLGEERGPAPAPNSQEEPNV